MMTHLYITARPATPIYGVKKMSHRKCIINHDLASSIIQYISNFFYRNGEHKVSYKLVSFTCSVVQWLASYGEWKVEEK